jgi:Ca2+-binding RTX toxin-like protein
VLVAAAGVLALTSPLAGAVTVGVSDEPGTYENSATLRIVADPGDDDALTVRVEENEATQVRVGIVDPAGGIESGHGCSIRDYSARWVSCSLPRPHPLEYTYCGRSCALPIEGSGLTASIVASLGDGDDSFDVGNLSGVDQSAIDVTVTAGSGDDTILTAEGEDRVEAGAGADQVNTNGGPDRIVAAAAPDGPDLYDLGSGYNTIDYSQRTQPVLYTAAGAGDDGAPGEGDTVRGATAMLSGSGDDVLSGGPGPEYFVAGEGNDRLSGGGGDDGLNGEGGENLLIGEDGNDTLAVERLSPPQAGRTVISPNRAEGGPGDDYMYMAAGRDIAAGGEGDDVFKMGGGDDVAAGGPGADRIYADQGTDLLAGEDDGDQLVGGEGSDRLLGGPGDDRLIAGVVANGLPPNPFHAQGQVESWRDSVGCGTGSDRALANPWDVLIGCERTRLVRAVEFGRPRGGGDGRARLLPITVRGPGRLLLTGSGVAKQVRTVTGSRYGRPYFLETRKRTLAVPLVLSTAAKRVLRRHGRLRLRIKARFLPLGGVSRSARESFLLR